MEIIYETNISLSNIFYWVYGLKHTFYILFSTSMMFIL